MSTGFSISYQATDDWELFTKEHNTSVDDEKCIQRGRQLIVLACVTKASGVIIHHLKHEPDLQ